MDHLQLKLLNYETFVSNIYEHTKAICDCLDIEIEDNESGWNGSPRKKSEDNFSKKIYVILDAVTRIKSCVVASNQQYHQSVLEKSKKHSSLHFSENSSVMTDETTTSSSN